MSSSRAIRAAVSAVVVTLALGTASAQGAAYAPHQLIVKLAPSVSKVERAGALSRLGLGDRLGTVRRIGAVIVHVAGDPASVAVRIDRSPLVDYAEPNLILHAMATPNDPLFGQLWGLNNTGQAGGTADADIDAPEGWSTLGLGGFPAMGGVKVGIVDTGIQKSHPDLANKVVNCAQSRGNLLFAGQIRTGCKDDNGHGTHTSGTITAKANNGIGVAGVAFNSQLAVCKALGANGSGFTSDVANCISWAHDRGAKGISMRATTETRPSSTPPPTTTSSRSPPPTATTNTPASPTPTTTSRSPRQAWTCSRPTPAAATGRCPAPRWRPRTWRGWPRCSGVASPRRARTRSSPAWMPPSKLPPRRAS